MKNLKRYPERKNDLLQAWDSADELILQYWLQYSNNKLAPTLAGQNPRILILNDQFGALSCPLAHLDVTCYTDSYISYRGIQKNLSDCDNSRIRLITRLKELEGEYDLVFTKIPKNLSFFEDQLCHLSSHLKPGAQLICGYMVKYQTKTSFDLIQRVIGDTHTSLAQKKARLIFATSQEQRRVQSPYPISVKLGEDFEIPFTHHSNLFSREKLDVGTRFFLENIPEGNYSHILDLGCGNGVVGISAQLLNPDARITFSDESQMAVDSSQANYQAYFKTEADFKWTHSGESIDSQSADLVLCNPPFHQGNTVGDFVAWQMFQDSLRVLKPDGLLRIVGNTHLGYFKTLKKIFGNCEVVATNSKFTILDSIKRI